ncbi:hypothetical protein P9112_010611 [Eukaryota sp. TZLM1-RC]
MKSIKLMDIGGQLNLKGFYKQWWSTTANVTTNQTLKHVEELLKIYQQTSPAQQVRIGHQCHRVIDDSVFSKRILNLDTEEAETNINLQLVERGEENVGSVAQKGNVYAFCGPCGEIDHKKKACPKNRKLYKSMSTETI